MKIAEKENKLLYYYNAKYSTFVLLSTNIVLSDKICIKQCNNICRLYILFDIFILFLNII